MVWLTGLFGKFGSWIAGIFLEFIWKKLVALFRDQAKQVKDKKTEEAKADADMGKANELTPQSSEKEVSDAIDDELRHF